MESVDALIHKQDDRVRKEFEKWAILSYSDNRAIINDKKGADRGIDGTAFILGNRNEEGTPQPANIIFSVKSGKVGSAYMRDLRGTIEREGAAGGILITREDPTSAMTKEAKGAGKFTGEFATFDRLQIVTVQQILDGSRMNLPMYEVARKAKATSDATQEGLF
jgi:site-specific DNA-methyltransferase (adenine-specific)